MARGVFSGVIWGGIVAAVGAGGLSLAYPDFKPMPRMQEAAPAPAQAGQEPQSAAETQAPAAAPEQGAEVAAPQDKAMEDAPQAQAAAEPEPESETAQTDAQADAQDEMAAETSAAADEVTAPEQMTQSAEIAEEPAEPAQEGQDEEALPDAPTEAPASEADDAAEESIAALPETDGEGTVGNLAPNVTTGRLPSVTAEDADEDEEGPTARAPAPIERFAAAYEADEGKPLMAIVLMDEGDAELGVEALEAFPYPLSFAVDASKPDAAERMQIYRDKGFEVLALVDLPRGATPADVEVAMTAYAAAVPEAVGFLEGVETGVQSGRDVTDQITQIVLDSGHGFLFQPSGLNTARKLAEREGVPAGTVFRDFDGNGQSASVMRRFLDQAAFRAGQEGGVIMLGRLQGETISALLIWGLADRASRVSLVPVSAVLTQQ